MAQAHGPHRMNFPQKPNAADHLAAFIALAIFTGWFAFFR